MSRSKWKGPYVSSSLIGKVRVHRQQEIKRPIKIWSRSSTITPLMVDMNFQVHSGRDFKNIFVKPEMIGHKFGEFVLTRKFIKHSGDKVKSRVRIMK